MFSIGMDANKCESNESNWPLGFPFIELQANVLLHLSAREKNIQN